MFNAALDSLHVSYSHTASCSHDTAVDHRTCRSTSLVCFLFLFLCVCLAAEPETSGEEGTMLPISPESWFILSRYHHLFNKNPSHTHIYHSFYSIIF